MFLALAIKQAGGTLAITRQTFMEIDDNFEIMTSKNIMGEVVLSLVEGAELVSELRKTRAIADAQQGIIHAPE